MSSLGAVIERPEIADPGLPNKFTYLEFAGFAGEGLLHKIVNAILPLALCRTWEIFEREHACDNDCFLGLAKAAQYARRTQRTINRNIATLCARGLMVLRSEYKLFRNPDGSVRRKAVVVKDFAGLYALAHEYYLWQHSPDYIEPELEYVDLVRQDEHLVAKLRRFEDYRRILYHQRPGPEVQAKGHEEDLWFSTYEEGASLDIGALKQVINAEYQSPGQDETKYLSKELPNQLSEVPKDRFNEKAYNESLYVDSFDSDKHLKEGGKAGSTITTCSQDQGCIAPGYKKKGQEHEAGMIFQNESKTNPVTPSQTNDLAGAGKTGVREEMHQEVLQARQAMAVAGIKLGEAVSRQAELPLPPKHPLARSFVHEIAMIFGDLNEKGSKTGIERSIETFNLEKPKDVLLCLVRAYVVARDTRNEKVRHRHPQSGVANRMPLFCSMFKKFAQSLGPGSAWQYTWEQMLTDIEADDRLGIWVSEHQAELNGEAIDQAVASGSATPAPPEAVAEPEGVQQESPAPLLPDTGWKTSEEAYDWAAYLLQVLAENGYSDLTVKISLLKGKKYYHVLVVDAVGEGYRLMSEEDIAYVIAQVRHRLFSITSEVERDQPAAGD